MKKETIRSIQERKDNKISKRLNMLTCYDYQTAQLLNETNLEMILVGDSVGNVILGHETTVEVTLNEMKIFSAAVKRGAPDKFIVADLPFGSYSTFELGIKNALDLFQYSKVECLKLEGANEINYKVIKRLTEIGIPVIGHIGLMPQSVHSQGGYYKHGKTQESKTRLLREAVELQAAGCFAIVLECVHTELSSQITDTLKIPTIGIGSGNTCDGQVLVINDLLGLTRRTPSFVKPIGNLLETKKTLIESYLS